MEYIITEQQLNNWKRNNAILEFINDKLTPYDGFGSSYDNAAPEYFFSLVGMPDFNDYDHMWWVSCNNYDINTSMDCPFLVLPKGVYGSLDAYFGEDSWQPMVKEWFEGHTSLQVNDIGTF